jgi:hypothetical protein
MHTILKTLLMVAVECISVGLINTLYHCDYKRVHIGYIMQPAHSSSSVVFEQSHCKGVFFTGATSGYC